jgi:hypothetical protein
VDLLLTTLLALGLTAGLTVVFGRLAEGRFPELPGGLAALRGGDGLGAVASLLLAALALALLPWPLHPAGERAWIGHPLLLWAAVEGAFLIPLLPGLLAPSPLGARGAMREAQIGVAGRCVIWLAVAAGLWLGAGWEAATLPGRLLAALAGLLALPAAAGVGPFGAERSLNLAGAEEGLDEQSARLLRFARTARGAVLLAALTVASLPLAATAAPVALVLAAAVFVVVALALGRVGAGPPRLTLPAALRWCWWRALPLAAAGLAYLAIVRA